MLIVRRTRVITLEVLLVLSCLAGCQTTKSAVHVSGALPSAFGSDVLRAQSPASPEAIDPLEVASPSLPTASPPRTVPAERLAQATSAPRRPGAAPNTTTPAGGLSSIARNRAFNQREEDNAADFPDIHDDPGANNGVSKDDYDPFVFPWLVNLLTEDLWSLERDPAVARKKRLERRARVDIRDPDPDTANFPNGAYTLPKGRAYIESSPVGLYGPSKLSSRQYHWEYLFRYGVTDNLEFRLFSGGLTSIKGQHPTTGVAPLAFDFKINFWEENRKYFIPAVGLEVYIQTNFGSPALNGGTQPSLNLLLDQSLPFEINFEHNFSLTGLQVPSGTSVYEFGYSYSFQRQLFKDFDIFTHGFYNTSSLPRDRLRNLGSVSPIPQNLTLTHPNIVVAGVGAIWTLSNRVAIFGSYNFGLTKYSPSTIALFGLAYAF